MYISFEFALIFYGSAARFQAERLIRAFFGARKGIQAFAPFLQILKAQSCGLRENIEGLSDNGMKCDILLSYFS